MIESDGSTASPRAHEQGFPGSVLLGVPRWTRDGGVSAHVQTSAAILARHGLDVHVLAARIEATEEIPGVTVHRCPDLYHDDVPLDERIGEAMALRPEVIHLHQVDLPDVVRLMRTSAPVVISAHNYLACSGGVHYFRPGQECDRSHGPACMVNMLVRGCAHTRTPRSFPQRYRNASRTAAALADADMVVSYSTSVDRHLAENGLRRRGLVPYPVTIPASSEPVEIAARRVVFAGRLVREKGVEILIRAAQRVDAEFVICGDGRRLASLRKLAERSGVAGRFVFKGWLGPERLAREFASASVVVVPSLWPEPFGLVGIEALAAGRPVVASATGGVGDWLDDGVSGLCVKPGDVEALAHALNRLLADPRLQHAMGLAGREAVETRFSTERHLEAILDAYSRARTAWASGGHPHAPHSLSGGLGTRI